MYLISFVLNVYLHGGEVGVADPHNDDGEGKNGSLHNRLQKQRSHELVHWSTLNRHRCFARWSIRIRPKNDVHSNKGPLIKDVRTKGGPKADIVREVAWI